jgi:hypothetical protein
VAAAAAFAQAIGRGFVAVFFFFFNGCPSSLLRMVVNLSEEDHTD